MPAIGAEVVLAAARRARFAILTALTVVAILALATGATSAIAASTPSLGVVAVGQLNVQDGLDDGRVGFRRGTHCARKRAAAGRE